MRKIFEDIFDDIEPEELTPSMDDIDFGDEKADGNYSFKLIVIITTIDKKYRKDLNTFMTKLKQFDSLLKYCLTYSNIVSDFNDKITYGILDNKLNSHYDIYKTWIYSRYKTDAPEEFDYQGLHFYNDKNLFNRDDLVPKFSQFTFKVSLNFTNNQKKEMGLYVLLDKTIAKICNRVYPGSKPAVVNSIGIKNFNTDKSIGFNKTKLDDIYNRKDTKSVKGTARDVHRLIYGNNDYTYINRYFENAEYSAEAFSVLKMCDLKIDDVYLHEDDKCIRIELKNDKVSMKPWIISLMRFLDTVKRRVFIVMNGTLRVFIANYNDQKQIDKFFDLFSINMNKVVLTLVYSKKESRSFVNLRTKIINELQIKYELLTDWDKRQNHDTRIEVLTNQSDPPKKLKIKDPNVDSKK